MSTSRREEQIDEVVMSYEHCFKHDMDATNGCPECMKDRYCVTHGLEFEPDGGCPICLWNGIAAWRAGIGPVAERSLAPR